jgi:hypothetical protein
MDRYPASLPILAGVLALFGARSAVAAVPDCPSLGIEIAPELGARWPELPNLLHDAFQRRDDIEHCAGIRLMFRDGSVIVEVTLPDGRSATRTVSRPDDILPTLESLLLVPQLSEREQTSELAPSGLAPSPPKSTSTAPNAPPARPRDVPLERRMTVEEPDASEQSPLRQTGRLRIELSVVTGGRIGDGQTGVGLGALSFLELSGWLVGFEGRADRYRPLSGGPTDGGALELALLAGRRFRFHSLALDLIAGPAAAMQGTATFEAQSSMTGEDVTKSSSSVVPRLLLGTRLCFSALSAVRPFVGIDGEAGPSRATTDVPGASRLPVWTLGLALGATVGTK